MKKLLLLLTIIIGLLCTACQSETKRKVQNIETFAKLYGYARWFHPSNEAQEIDWDKFAVLGVQKIENIKSTQELRDTLYQLFSPIVQGLQIYKTSRPEKFNSEILMSPDLEAKPVAWQHYGVFLNDKPNIYRSVKTHVTIPHNSERDGAILYKVLKNPFQLQGREVKFSGYFKSSSKNCAKLFILYNFKNDSKIHETSIIESVNWQKQECVVKIPENVVNVSYGLWMLNNGEVWADDLMFLVNSEGKWESVDELNFGFENGQINDNNDEDWKTENLRHSTLEITDGDSHSGKYSLKLTYNYSGTIFDRMPQFGEIICEPIGSNLTCVVPLVLLTNDSATYPKSEISSLVRLKSEINNIQLGKEFNSQVNLASVVIAWNVLAHFFPYFDVIDTDWNKVLTETLKNALTNTRKKDFFITLSRMIAQIEDGHGWFENPEQWYNLPVRTELVENKIVITTSRDTILKRGDVIKKIDGELAMKVLNEKEKLISGSPQLRRYRALNILGSKLDSSNTHLVIERDGKKRNVIVTNSPYCKPEEKRKYQNETIVEIEPGIYYVNMNRIKERHFDKKMNELANAKAVIYDQRDAYGQNFHYIIPHLIEEPVTSPWWNVPQTIYPNRKNVEFDITNWSTQPKQPLFISKTVIINNPGVVSAGETMMGIIEHYNLATTVGESTAGCNGNINFINLPCGYTIGFTGMKVLKQDGSQHYHVGYEPDYQIYRTIRAIKEGRDEALEKALEIARYE